MIRMIHAARLLLAPLLLVSAGLPTTAEAWGREGHRVIGHLAEARLSPAARDEVARLLADEAEPSLAGVSTWADEVRDLPEWRHTASWHWVNLPRETPCRFEAARDCAPRQCIVGAIREQLGLLADRRQPRERRAEALKFVVHFVGDVHQPFHAGFADDRGGNLAQVRWQRRGWNLHAIWDSALVRHAGLEPEAYARQLAGGPPLPEDRSLALAAPEVEWALESCRMILDEVLYPERPVIGQAYLEAKRPLAEQRMRQAGERLAAVLEQALAPTP
jgi:hypothetical protein